MEVAELLLDSGAMLDVAGGFDHDTPLHDAVANGRIEVAKLLVSRGAPLDVRYSIFISLFLVFFYSRWNIPP